ncbi:MAG: hypothetical protein ACLSDJ_08940 [Butyricimonas faecihominis]
MKKWNQIYEWSRRVRTYLEGDFSSSSLDEEDVIVRRVTERLSDPNYLRRKRQEQRRFDAEAAFEKLRKRNRHRLAVRVGMAAASVAILLGVWLLRGDGDDGERAVGETGNYPEGTKAVLLLEDGRKFELKDSLPVKIETGNGVIQVDAKGVVLGADAEGEEKSEDGYNTLFIPRGGEYHLTLSDGTLVWLNSESELYFPMQFKGDSRQVYLKGSLF